MLFAQKADIVVYCAQLYSTDPGYAYVSKLKTLRGRRKGQRVSAVPYNERSRQYNLHSLCYMSVVQQIY